jgi:hypothetical protein
MDIVVLYIICDLCKKKQVFHGQYRCENCQKGFSPFSVATQILKIAEEAKKEKK